MTTSVHTSAGTEGPAVGAAGTEGPADAAADAPEPEEHDPATQGDWHERHYMLSSVDTNAQPLALHNVLSVLAENP